MLMLRGLTRGIGRLLRLLLLAGMLAAVPYGLVTQIGWPLPRTRPDSFDDVQEWLTTPVTDQMVINALAIALWLLWVSFTASAVAEIVGALRGVTVPRLGALAPMQDLTGWLLSGLTAGILATGLSPAASTPPVEQTPAVQTQSGAPPAATAATRPYSASASNDANRAPQWHQLATNDTTEHLVYEVAEGDWMWHIAGRYLGDEHRYPEIAALNPSYHDTYDTYPDHIQPGDHLVLPDDAHDRGERPHATGTTVTGQPPDDTDSPEEPQPEPPETTPQPPPEPPPPEPTPPPATPEPAPTLTPPGTTADPTPGHDGVVDPPTETATPAPDHPPTTEPHPDGQAEPQPQTGEHGPEGVDLPTGWLTVPAAAAIAAVAAIALINRRRRWQPGELATDQHPDPVNDIPPPRPSHAPLNAASGTAAQPDSTGHNPEQPGTNTDLDNLENTAATTSTATIGATDQQYLHLTGLPARGVALTGPGATAAARGLLAATLTAGGPHRPDLAAEAITTSDLLTELELATVDLPRLSTATTTHQALNELQAHINSRYRALSDQPDPTDHDLPDPPLLVLLASDLGQHSTRLEALADLGQPVGVHVVLLGPSPDRTTWHVNSDGHTSGNGQPGPRLNTLTPQTTNHILTTAAEAQPAHAEPPPAPPRPPQPASNPSPSATAPAAPPAHTPRDGKLLLRILGKPTAEDPHQQPIKIQRSAAIHLAVYLALHPDGASKDTMLEDVLGDKTMSSARQTFDSAIHQLRRALIHPTTGKSALARHRNGTYHLDPDVIDVDWWQLQHAADTANPQQVIASYPGPLAHGIDQDWLPAPREYARKLVLTAHDELADTATTPEQALEHVEAALRIDPYAEHFYRRAMRIYASNNDPGAVRRTLKRLADRLATIDTEPTEATRELATQLISESQPDT